MNLGELRAFVAENSDMPDEMPVILQKDAEGNRYSPLSGAQEGMYLADSTWSGDVYMTDKQLDLKLRQPGTFWSEEDRAPEGCVRALILWPVN